MCVVFCLWQGAPAKQLHPDDFTQSPAPSQNAIKPTPAPVIYPIRDRQNDNKPIDKCPESGSIWRDPQWLAVCVTAIYTLFSGFTLFAVFRQNRSIQNTERAVLVPSWDNLVHLNPEAAPGKLAHCFQWNFQNCRKTPGFIRELQGTLILLESMADLPRRPKYDKRISFQSDPLIPGKMMETMIYSPLDDSREYQAIEVEFRKNGKILFAYGFVRYEDIFGRMHETRFGLRYAASEAFRPSEDHFVVAGPKAYNQYN
jgi:hypothetical protein